MLYDVVIIGAGPSGLSAAIYASRAKLKTLIIEKKWCGGKMATIGLLENYPGFYDEISGHDLSIKFEKHAVKFGAKLVYDEVKKIDNNTIKKIITVNSNYNTKSIIIATGTSIRKTNILGEEIFIGKGVSFCATCDAPFYKDKTVLVIGGGDSAIQESIYLSKFAKNVIIIHRRNKLRATSILQKRITLYSNIFILYNYLVKEILGKNTVEKVIIENIKTHKKKEMKIDGVFIFVGQIPNTSFVTNITLSSNQYIITDNDMNTSVSGIFACGDVREKLLKQIIISASDGAVAAIGAQNYIELCS
ncbi:MAG: thioredoxin-disulfide reductase [Endomicrobium sp.]|jgi:thioredoxin reductase (NADPH)|nr:thioredoxin-disulfide reductase [Endomicrobium sp.]